MSASASEPFRSSVLLAELPAPPTVHALTTLRGPAGNSLAPFDRLNLGARCGDDAAAVARNRDALVEQLRLPSAPRWLHQVHGTDVARFDGPHPDPPPQAEEGAHPAQRLLHRQQADKGMDVLAHALEHQSRPQEHQSHPHPNLPPPAGEGFDLPLPPPAEEGRDGGAVAGEGHYLLLLPPAGEGRDGGAVAAEGFDLLLPPLAGEGRDGGEPVADAAITSTPGVVLAILTADCLPVLFASADGSVVAAAHAGWRGLAAGVLERTVAAMRSAPKNISAWLGPAAGPQAYEVGEEVRAAFVDADPRAACAFVATRPQHWLCDLYALARLRLTDAGMSPASIHGGGLCTISDPARFYSHRRDGRTGRMASLIWINPEAPAA